MRTRRSNFEHSRVRDWPRITFYYGIGPAELARMPRNILELYADSLSVLRAERLLDMMAASGYPHMKEPAEFHAKVVAELERYRDTVQQRTLEKPAPIDQKTLAALGSMGLGIQGVPRLSDTIHEVNDVA